MVIGKISIIKENKVHGRVNVSPEEKGKLDGYYYEHISLWLDIKLFIQTLFHATNGDDTEKKANKAFFFLSHPLIPSLISKRYGKEWWSCVQ